VNNLLIIILITPYVMLNNLNLKYLKTTKILTMFLLLTLSYSLLIIIITLVLIICNSKLLTTKILITLTRDTDLKKILKITITMGNIKILILTMEIIWIIKMMVNNNNNITKTKMDYKFYLLTRISV